MCVFSTNDEKFYWNISTLQWFIQTIQPWPKGKTKISIHQLPKACQDKRF